MRIIWVVVIFCVTPTVAAIGSALANDAEAWQLDCPASKKIPCQMSQSIAPERGGIPEFLLTIAAAGSQQHFAVVTVPLRVYLAPGIELQVDKRRPYKALYELCDETGCHAGFKLSGPVLAAFRLGKAAKVRVWTGKDKAVEFPVSLRGFSRKFDVLATGSAH